jgi:hypothetical protein
MSLWMIAALLVYFFFLSISIYFLWPPIRNKLRPIRRYKKNLHYTVIARQILLFFAPTAFAALVLDSPTVSQQLTALFALGLSIEVFWIAVFPQLTKAQLFIDFRVDNIGDFTPEIILAANTEHLVATRIYNMGFSTLKNAMVLLYFGSGFEIVPFANSKYRGLDFEKEFTIQKENCGVLFVPTKNYQTIPPQEWFLFPVIVKSPNVKQDCKITLQFASENSWGLTEHHIKVQIK